MRKLGKRLFLCFLVTCIGFGLLCLRDLRILDQQLIRMHVIANSDDPSDQRIKLAVRDAVLESIQEDLRQIADVDTAAAYLRENLPKLQLVANQTLQRLGVSQEAVVTFCREAFPVRYYDTFRLPSGIYDTLKVVIGEGAGKNWWCVTFPTLCLPETSEAFQAAAAEAELPQSLIHTLSGGEAYEIRFFLLDLLGRLQSALRDRQ